MNDHIIFFKKELVFLRKKCTLLIGIDRATYHLQEIITKSKVKARGNQKAGYQSLYDI